MKRKIASPQRGSANSKPCFRFQKSGTCKFGDECRFSHDQVTTSNAPVQGTMAMERKKIAISPSVVIAPPPKPTQQGGVFTNRKFTELPMSAITQTAIAKLNFETMTKIQSMSIEPALRGQDVLIRAKTGHGKTLAFGLPIIEHLVAKGGRMAVIINPTRELALQTQTVLKPIMDAHRKNIYCVIGGTNMNREKNDMQRRMPDILIATPGRLLDHLTQRPDLVRKCSFVCLDEADRLLDEGFQRDMEKIFAFLPQNRQTILASATLPVNLGKYKHLALKEDHVMVSAFSEELDNQVNARLVEQFAVISPDNWAGPLFSLLMEAQTTGSKVIVFVQAAQTTKLVAMFFSSMPSLNGRVFEMHSRMSQSARVKQLEAFKGCPGGILFSSDVGARGWDIDNIQLVIQLGMPADTDTYVHRVGRTARAGEHGRSLCFLYNWEEKYFLKILPRLKPLRVESPVATPQEIQQVQEVAKRINRAQNFHASLAKGYQGFLGFQNSFRKKCKMSPVDLVSYVNTWVREMGVTTPPRLTKRAVGKMNLRGTAGLLVE